MVDAIAIACIEIARLTDNAASSAAGEPTHGKNADGDLQKDLDIKADQIRHALSRVPITAFASEEGAKPELHGPKAKTCEAVDPVDGFSNIEINVTVGTILSITASPRETSAAFRHNGTEQIAAGFVVYGPQTSLVLTLGEGVDIFTLDRAEGVFKRSRRKVEISTATAEFANEAHPMTLIISMANKSSRSTIRMKSIFRSSRWDQEYNSCSETLQIGSASIVLSRKASRSTSAAIHSIQSIHSSGPKINPKAVEVAAGGQFLLSLLESSTPSSDHRCSMPGSSVTSCDTVAQGRSSTGIGSS